MAEKLPPDIAMPNFDYFLGRPEDAELRDEYIRRGLIPTNNLHMYFRDKSEQFEAGPPNPMDYSNKSFGYIIERLRQNQPELWAQAREASLQQEERLKEYAGYVFAGQQDNAQALKTALEAGSWTHAEVFSQVFRLIAPEMLADGLDPLEACI